MRAALAASLIVCSIAAPAQAPVLDVAPVRLSFIAAAGGSVPAQTVQLRQTAGEPLRWRAEASAPWIRLSATTGTGDTALQVGVDGRGLAPGRHEGRVTVSGPPGAGTHVVTVLFQISNRARGTPSTIDSPAALTLSAPPGSREPASTTLNLQGGPDAPTVWRVKPDQAWLSVDPASGRLPARVTVTAVPEGAAPGENAAALVFTDEEGEAWMTVPVVFLVGSADSLSIATDVLPPATRNLPYAQAIPILGGKPPYAIRILQGRLPQGLVLAGGALSGVARNSGSFPLVLEVTDASTPPVSATRQVLLQVIVLYQDTALVVSPPSLSLVARVNQRTPGTRLAVGSGRQPLAWRATTDASWLRLSPDRGLSPSVLQLDVDAARMEPGTYMATVTITMDGAPNSPARVPVQVEVRR